MLAAAGVVVRKIPVYRDGTAGEAGSRRVSQDDYDAESKALMFASWMAIVLRVSGTWWISSLRDRFLVSPTNNKDQLSVCLAHVLWPDFRRTSRSSLHRHSAQKLPSYGVLPLLLRWPPGPAAFASHQPLGSVAPICHNSTRPARYHLHTLTESSKGILEKRAVD